MSDRRGRTIRVSVLTVAFTVVLFLAMPVVVWVFNTEMTMAMAAAHTADTTFSVAEFISSNTFVKGVIAVLVVIVAFLMVFGPTAVTRRLRDTWGARRQKQ